MAALVRWHIRRAGFEAAGVAWQPIAGLPDERPDRRDKSARSRVSCHWAGREVTSASMSNRC